MFIKRWKYQEEAGEGGDAGAGGAGDGGDAGAGKAGEGAGDDGGKGAPANKWPDTWRQELAGDNEKELKQLERYQSPKDIWNKARALEQRLSSGELRSTLPKDATPEQLTAWRAENSIPESPDKYEIKFGDGGLPEEDRPVIDSFLTAIHGKNVNNEQAKATVDWYYAQVQRQTEEREDKDREFAKQSEDTLRSEWGNDYRPNINSIDAIIDLAPNDVKDLIRRGRLANGDPFLSNPSTMKWLAGLALQINPVTTVIPNAGANIGSAIDDEIAGIEKLMRTDRKAYNEDEKKQARYRELLDAKDRLGAKR